MKTEHKQQSVAMVMYPWSGSYFCPADNEQKDAKETARCKQVFIVAERFNIVVSNFLIIGIQYKMETPLDG